MTATGTGARVAREGAAGGRGGRGRPARRGRRVARRAVVLLLLVALALPLATAARIVQVARWDQRPAADALVVLGASQLDGSPGPVLEARLQHALDLHEAGVAPVVVTTGSNQEGDRFTEAGSAAEWLVERGVPAEQVLAVPEGSNTYRSLLPVSQVARERGWDGVVVVSDPWHVYRVRVMADTVALPVAGSSPVREGPSTEVPSRVVSYVARETAGVLAHHAAVVLDKAGSLRG
jgi:uncharacterized SAM-binding protein YcdF (DUF218 family)